MKKIDISVLEKLNRKYSHYGTIYDADPNGSIEPSDIPWGIAKEIVLERDGYKCRICGRSPIAHEIKNGTSKVRFELEVHHIIPRIAGGTNSTKNLLTLCKQCHVKTFKNNYAGLPSNYFTLIDGIDLFSNCTELTKIGKLCESIEVYSFYFRDQLIKIKIPIKGSICNYLSLDYVYDYLENNAIDYDEIIIKNKKGNLLIGLIENYQPI